MGDKSRINKYLALAGVCSRRAADDLISSGRVTVNGQVFTELGRQIDHDLDKVEVDGKIVTPAQRKRYVLLNKPAGTVTTLDDPHGRPTVISHLEDSGLRQKVSERIFPVGRLDFDTEGALLLTNDGDMAHRLTHPRYQVEKVYQALVDGSFGQREADKIAAGIELEDGHLGKAQARLQARKGKNSLVELTLTEGHKREVKQLLAGCDLRTLKLKRVRFGCLTTDGLPLGKWRELTAAEIKAVRKLTLM